MRRRSTIARDLRTPKYRQRVVADKRRAESRRACRSKSDGLDGRKKNETKD